MDTSPQDSQSLTIGVPRETVDGERRVGLVPETVSKLTASGLTVAIEAGAGLGAFNDDEAYLVAGARIAETADTVYQRADIIARVQPPSPEDIRRMRPGSVLISFLDPARNADIVQHLSERGIVAFSFNALPRVTRAQSMDAMSSMSTVGGYRAVLLAANELGRFFPLLMTAAGTVAPAHVLVVGAGVAGLQALATARRLGAVTEACDTRPAVREQVQSVGARFVDMSLPLDDMETAGGYAREMDEEFYRRERDIIRENVARADVVITTALVPGKTAPLLVDEAMVRSMRPGSVVVDLAAEAGGNCELTVPGERVVRHRVTILGPLNLPSTVPVHASQMYSRNVESVIRHMVKEGKLELDLQDEILRSACITSAQAFR